MTPLTITFDQAKRAGACEETYRAMGRHLGGIASYERQTPVPLETMLDVCGIDDALWGMNAIGAHKAMRLFAADCAERVLPIYEKPHPGDRRPRAAIEAARAYARGEIDAEGLLAARDVARHAAWATWYAARDAARSAAWAAAGDAARDARAAARATWYAARDARAAAGDAEREWQTERLRAYLRGEVAP